MLRLSRFVWIHTQKVYFVLFLAYALVWVTVPVSTQSSTEQDRLHSLQGVFASLQARFHHRSQDMFVYTQTSTVDRSHASSSARSISFFISAPKWVLRR